MAGRGGLRVTWGDGTVTTYAPGDIIRLDELPRAPVRIEGRMMVLCLGDVGYEAPAMVVCP